MTKTLTSEYIPGKTKVRVFKMVQTLGGRLVPEQIHSGVCVQKTTTAVRVYDPSVKSSDANPESSELFAIKSGMVWCEIAGQLDDGRELPIPVVFR
jgi:hypothetical protein